MSLKLYVEGNYFFAVDSENSNEIECFKSEAKIERHKTYSTQYVITFGSTGNRIVEFSDLRDENGDAFASQDAFKTWYTSNTGFNTATGGSVAYKTYRAIVTQSSTDAPTAVVLENTLGGDVVWTRSDVGEYLATLASAFPADGFFVESNFLDYSLTGNESLSRIARNDDNSVYLVVQTTADWAVTDDWVLYISIKVKV